MSVRPLFFSLILTAQAATFGAGDAAAHSGGLNAQGCHAGSQPYHCHRSPSDMVGNRLRCDLGSRSSACARRPVSPAAASPSPTPTSLRPDVLTYQRQLLRHCTDLPPSFVDGRDGPATRAVLRRFQRAHGLVADGEFGPSTAWALLSGPSGRC